MKNLNNPVQITITPIKWIAGALLIGLMVLNLFQWNSAAGLRTINKELKKENDNLLEQVESRIEQRIKDSIQIVNRNEQIRLKDSIVIRLEASESYFKNRAYTNYKKLLNEQKANYNNADDAVKRSTLSELAKEG